MQKILIEYIFSHSSTKSIAYTKTWFNEQKQIVLDSIKKISNSDLQIEPMFLLTKSETDSDTISSKVLIDIKI